jgi:thioredoxin reductase (NADPH)
MKNIIVYGADWCPDCHRSRKFLDENNILYTYLDIDSDKSIKAEMLSLTDNKNIIPTIVLSNGQILQEPSNQVLAQALNDFKSVEPDNEVIDLVIIGAGPASLTTAIYTTRENIKTIIFEKAVIGGLAAVTDLIDNYPGFEDGISGLDLADKLEKQAKRFGAQIEFNTVQKIKLLSNNDKKIYTENGIYIARAVLIATGTDYKKINVLGEKEYLSRGVHYCATCDGAFYKDKEIAVVGGGNSAVQETIFLTKFATKIHLLVRSKIKASQVLQKKLQSFIDSGQVVVHLQTNIVSILGDNQLVNKILIKQDNIEEELPVDGVFIFVGLKPNSEFLNDSSIELDQLKFIKTNDNLLTSMNGVFAAGDIRSGSTMQIASAVGEGATAALRIRQYLEEI